MSRQLVILPGLVQTEREFRAAVLHLSEHDPNLARIVTDHGQPDFWTRQPGFATLVLFILEQQVSLASAAAAFNRLQGRLGDVSPETVLTPTDEELRADGLSRQKARYVRLLAHAVRDGTFDLGDLDLLDDDTVRTRLTALTGIGPWTAEVYLLSCLRRPDVWPIHDRALQVATAEALELGEVPRPETLRSIGERWRPHRSTAARMLWHAYLARRSK
jgi:DNA-3-methyladenine glycosylase II